MKLGKLILVSVSVLCGTTLGAPTVSSGDVKSGDVKDVGTKSNVKREKGTERKDDDNFQCQKIDNAYTGTINFKLVRIGQSCHDLIENCHVKNHKYCDKESYHKKVLSSLVDPSLTSSGAKNIQVHSNLLKKFGKNTPDLVVSSELLRSIQTAATLYDKHTVYVAPYLKDKAQRLDGRTAVSVPHTRFYQDKMLEESKVDTKRINRFFMENYEGAYYPSSEIHKFPTFFAKQIFSCPNAFPEIENKLKRNEDINVDIVTFCSTMEAAFTGNNSAEKFDCEYAHTSQWKINGSRKYMYINYYWY